MLPSTMSLRIKVDAPSEISYNTSCIITHTTCSMKWPGEMAEKSGAQNKNKGFQVNEMVEKRFDSGEDEETRLTTTSRFTVANQAVRTESKCERRNRSNEFFEDNRETKQMKKHGDTILFASLSRVWVKKCTRMELKRIVEVFVLQIKLEVHFFTIYVVYPTN
ncbi:hypothetical protein LXL04_004348 [Taraxacum kok-saghyz]